MLDRWYVATCADDDTEHVMINADRVVSIEACGGYGFLLIVDWTGTEYANQETYIRRFYCEKPVSLSRETAAFWLIDRHADQVRGYSEVEKETPNA